MKKLCSIPVFIFGMVLFVGAQTMPPQVVKDAFQLKFPNAADMNWERETMGDWEAEFWQSGTKTSAGFSPEGQWLETETEITYADLPDAVKAAAKGRRVKAVFEFIRAEGRILYLLKMKQENLLFDASGKWIPVLEPRF